MLQPNIAASKTTDVIDTLKADHKHEQIHEQIYVLIEFESKN